jgi:Saccharopine dehydrogenase NADP binding domain
MRPYRVLVIGGTGFFGRRLVERLSRRAGFEIVATSRSGDLEPAWPDPLRLLGASPVSGCALDVRSPQLANQIKALAPQAVVHTAGPFQGQQYEVAQACITAGAHYIDLADGREFVAGIRCLDGPARSAGVAVISGASSVPALSSAVVDHLAQGLSRVSSIDIGISPGNRTERGLATVRAILGYCGKPLPASQAGRRFGWSGSWRHRYPAPVGSRLLSPCDVPDLSLLPARYPGSPSVRFGAGLELLLLHRGMNAMAMLTRWGLVPDWSAHAVALKRAGDWFKALGSDAGAMHVSVTGLTADGLPQTRHFHLLATHGEGPFVPTLAATALLLKLQRGQTPAAGAQPCIGLLTLQDFVRESEGLRITMTEQSP